MKSDSERKKYHKEKIHKRKKRLHVHLSKDLRGKLKKKKRSLLVHKGDVVKIMRGPGKGKEAKVSRVSTVKRKVFVEGVVSRNARAREMAMPLEPSNLLLVALESTKERKELFSADVFKKPAKPKTEKPKEAKPEKPEEPKAEKTEAPKPEKTVPKAADAPKPPEAPKEVKG